MDEDWIAIGVALLIIGMCFSFYGYNGIQEVQDVYQGVHIFTMIFGDEEGFGGNIEDIYMRYRISELFGAIVGLIGLVCTIYGFMANKPHELSAPIEESNGNRSMRTSDRLVVNELKMMKLFEFQNWVCKRIHGRLSEKKEDWMIGIDGWIVGEWKMRPNGLNTNKIPIQVKQSENISRNVVDSFETAIKKVKKDRGMIVAFSFDGGAYEEVARARLEDGLDIELKTVDEILERH